jgi:hypothetical protein
MQTTWTKDQYENYLNEIMEHEDPPQLAVKPGTYLSKPGSWMRQNDPIQFEVGYSEWLRETQNS